MSVLEKMEKKPLFNLHNLSLQDLHNSFFLWKKSYNLIGQNLEFVEKHSSSTLPLKMIIKKQLLKFTNNFQNQMESKETASNLETIRKIFVL